jgi:hypothetical protein
VFVELATIRQAMKAARCRARLVLAAAVLAGLVGCNRPSEPTADVLAAALNDYLAQRGQLCLGKTHWPIDLTQREIDAGARNALQMPVLERLGLVTSTVAEVAGQDQATAPAMKVRRYALTESGRRYYLVRGGAGHPPDGDFCAARLSLDRIVGWSLERDAARGGVPHVVVTYTYRVEAAPWTKDAEAQKVFPVVASVVRGAGSAELQESFTLTPTGWVAVDLPGT